MKVPASLLTGELGPRPEGSSCCLDGLINLVERCSSDLCNLDFSGRIHDFPRVPFGNNFPPID